MTLPIISTKTAPQGALRLNLHTQDSMDQNLKKIYGFEAKAGSFLLLRDAHGGGTLYVGMGKTTKLHSDALRTVGAHLWHYLNREKIFHTVLDPFVLLKDLHALESLLEGFLLASYKPLTLASTKVRSEKPINLYLNNVVSKTLKPLLEKLLILVSCVRITQNWCNQPSNIGTPAFYAEQAKTLAKDAGLKVTVLNTKEQIKQKMHLFLGVGAGSVLEGKVVIVEYAPKKFQKTITLVGKGVTFDSGGISIKPSARMEEMKFDMTGAATVLGATLAAAALKASNRIVCIMGFTENMPSGSAITPGHVIRARSGKTVEITNTDAEGRLVLADLLDYVQEYYPSDMILDVATLTGAVGVALGKLCCGIMGNHEGLIQYVAQASQATGERVWQLPLYPEYFEDIRSDYADMKNSSNSGLAGSIQGGIFLQQFIKNKTPWVHFDIAHTTYNLTHLPYAPKKGATGSYVRLLAHLITYLV